MKSTQQGLERRLLAFGEGVNYTMRDHDEIAGIGKLKFIYQ